MIFLNHVGVIEITGEDAHSFLQRQITVDMNEVTPSQSRLAAYLNPKGRVIANFIIIMRQQSYYLVLSNELLDTLSLCLKKFVFREKIDISKRSDVQFVGFREISGIAKSQHPQAPYETVLIDGTSAVRIPGNPARFGVLNAENVSDQSAALSADTIDTSIWKFQDFEAGIPWICKETSEQFLAQAINLDLVESLSWTKGCYPGQEIVARLHYRGGINRRMVQAVCCANGSPNPGDVITCPDLAGNQTGSVVNCINDENSKLSSLLISIPLKFINQEILLLSDSFPVKLSTNRLPYTIPQID